jgi:hypothetical protein
MAFFLREEILGFVVAEERFREDLKLHTEFVDVFYVFGSEPLACAEMFQHNRFVLGDFDADRVESLAGFDFLERPNCVGGDGCGHGDLLVAAEFRAAHGTYGEALEVELGKMGGTLRLPSWAVSLILSPNLMESVPGLETCSTVNTFRSMGCLCGEVVTA